MSLSHDLRSPGRNDMDTFEKTPHALMAEVRAGRLTAGDLFTYLTIAQLSFERGGEVNMPQPEFALAVGCKPRMLRYHLAALETKGWIAARKIGLGRICAYRPTSPTGAPQPSGNILPLDRPRPSGKRQDIAVQVATGLPFKRQNIAAVNRQTPVKTPADQIPQAGSPDSSSVADATAGLGQPIESIVSVPSAVPPEPTSAPSPNRSSPPKSPARPSGKPFLPVPKPRPAAEQAGSAQSRLVDLLRAGGVPEALKPSDRDFKAIKDKCQDVELVARCYLDIFHGRYGADWMRDQLSVQTVCYRFLDGYVAWEAQGRPAPRSQNGARNGPPQRRVYTAGAGAPNEAQVVESARQRAKGW